MYKVRVITGLIAALASSQVLAMAWVRDPYTYYVKLNFSQHTRHYNQDAGLDFEQEERNIGLYGEAGLPTPWKSQFVINTTHKTIERTEKIAKDSHKTAGMADTDLLIRHAIGKADLGIATLLVAADTGATIATTRDKYRTGNESDREGEVPAGREVLLASIDRGEAAYIYGGGLTLYSGPLWMNFHHDLKVQTDNQFNQAQTQLSLGVGLPMNSWAEAKFSQIKSAADPGYEVETGTTTSFYQWAIGGGFTFWGGWALEPEYRREQNADQTWSVEPILSLGVSHRTL